MFIIHLVFIISTFWIFAVDGKRYWQYSRAELKDNKPLPMAGLIGILVMLVNSFNEVLK